MRPAFDDLREDFTWREWCVLAMFPLGFAVLTFLFGAGFLKLVLGAILACALVVGAVVLVVTVSRAIGWVGKVIGWAGGDIARWYRSHW